MGNLIIATSAAALFESVPFIAAAALLARLPLPGSRMAPYLGCGCGAGPSALSLPAAAVTLLLFGAPVAFLRWTAALAASRALGKPVCPHDEEQSLPQSMFALLPAAVLAGFGSLLAPALLSVGSGSAGQFAAGLLAGFVLAPCGLGAVTFAAAMRGVCAPFAAGFLCVAGIADARAFYRVHGQRCGAHDAFAYALLALACGLVALHAGAQLVHPYLGLALGGCAVLCAVQAFRHRGARSPHLRFAPVLMLAGVFTAAAPPAYHVTETTLAQPFAGERIDFTGLATQTGAATTIVRYAIMCCRADAAPVVVRLSRAQPQLRGWVHASGVLESGAGGFALRVTALSLIAPPADPFVYR